MQEQLKDIEHQHTPSVASERDLCDDLDRDVYFADGKTECYKI
jgi:hypothetical protein